MKVVLEKNQTLFKEDQESFEMYYLEKGSLGIFQFRSGANHQVGTIYSGEVIGEMSFIDKQPRSATVVALTSCELVRIESEKFERQMKELPMWYQALVHTLLDRLRRTTKRVRV
jgi:CRP/FNR family transcriptional regulator, cyclic AMP receptor protein